MVFTRPAVVLIKGDDYQTAGDRGYDFSQRKKALRNFYHRSEIEKKIFKALT